MLEQIYEAGGQRLVNARDASNNAPKDPAVIPPAPQTVNRLSGPCPADQAPERAWPRIAGAADERGTPASNHALSRQRAASAAQCLATHAPSRRWSIEITGASSLVTSPAEYAHARLATVFVSEQQP